MLAQSKLQNLAQVGVKQLEERLINVEKTLIEETTSIDKISKKIFIQQESIDSKYVKLKNKPHKSKKNVAQPFDKDHIKFMN